METSLEGTLGNQLEPNSPPEVVVEARSVYGRTLYYPSNDTALAFTQLLKKHTLTKEDLAGISRLQFFKLTIRQQSLD